MLNNRPLLRHAPCDLCCTSNSRHWNLVPVAPCRYQSSGNALNRSQSLQLHGIESQLSSAEVQAKLYQKRLEAATTTVGLMKST